MPTSLEAGYPNSDYTVWYGVFMPAKTPRAIVEKFHDNTAKVLRMPSMREKLAQLAVDPMPMMPGDFDKYVAAEIEANGKLIKAAGVR